MPSSSDLPNNFEGRSPHPGAADARETLTPEAAIALLASGFKALQYRNYSKALPDLEAYFAGAMPTYPRYHEAQIWRIKACFGMGRTEEAIALAEVMAQEVHPVNQRWAQEFLAARAAESIEAEALAEAQVNPDVPDTAPDTAPEPPVQAVVPGFEHIQPATPKLKIEAAAQLLEQGRKAMHYRHYEAAIAALSPFLAGSDASYPGYAQAQIWQIKAFDRVGRVPEAAALCQALTGSDNSTHRLWAQEFLVVLVAKLAQDQQLPGMAGVAQNGAIANQAPVASRSGSSQSGSSQSGASQSTEPPQRIQLKSVDQLKQFYFNHLLRDLAAYEVKRKQALIYIGIGTGVAVLAAILLSALISGIAVNHGSRRGTLFLSMGYMVILMAWVGTYAQVVEHYAEGFKSKIIRRIVEFIDPNQALRYSVAGDDTAAISAFRHSRLCGHLVPPNSVQQDDCVSGQLGQTQMHFSEVRFEEVTTRLKSSDDGGPWSLDMLFRAAFLGLPYIASHILRGQRLDFNRFSDEIFDGSVSRTTIFKGLFLRSQFPKHLKTHTLVLPKGKQGKHSPGMEIVRLEDPVFAKYFTVLGQDQVEARYALSTNLINRLVTFRKRAGKDVYVSMLDNAIYIGVAHQQDLFEPKLFKPMRDFAPVQEYFEMLQLMMSTVDELNLNRRIWQ